MEWACVATSGTVLLVFIDDGHKQPDAEVYRGSAS